MLRDQDGNVLLERYRGIAEFAIFELDRGLQRVAGYAIPTGPRDRQRDYLLACNVRTDMAACQFGAHHTRRLVQAICRAHNLSVSFLSLSDAPQFRTVLRNYVSWLVVLHMDAGQLFIIYDRDQLRQSPVGGADIFAKDKLLAKIFLHECAHAMLHLQVFFDRIRAGTRFPSLDDIHELEAWFYALTTWGSLTGDHGCGTHADQRVGVDKGWELA